MEKTSPHRSEMKLEYIYVLKAALKEKPRSKETYELWGG